MRLANGSQEAPGIRMRGIFLKNLAVQPLRRQKVGRLMMLKCQFKVLCDGWHVSSPVEILVPRLRLGTPWPPGSAWRLRPSEAEPRKECDPRRSLGSRNQESKHPFCMA